MIVALVLIRLRMGHLGQIVCGEFGSQPLKYATQFLPVKVTLVVVKDHSLNPYRVSHSEVAAINSAFSSSVKTSRHSPSLCELM